MDETMYIVYWKRKDDERVYRGKAPVTLIQAREWCERENEKFPYIEHWFEEAHR